MADTSYLDTIHEAHRALTEVRYRLDDLSSALRTIGLSDLGYELSSLAAAIGNASSEINGAVSRNLSEMVREQEQSMGQIFTTLLDGRAPNQRPDGL